MDKAVTKILLTHEEIVAKIKQIAVWINNEYKNDKNLILVTILKGAMPFAAELIKHINIDHIMDFMVISSYKGTNSTGQFKVVLDLNESIKNKRVLILEDIIETGNTVKHLKQFLYTRKPTDIKIITLLSKSNLHDAALTPDKVGFDIQDDFVVGFGLDYNEKYRNFPYIGIFNKKFL